MATKPAPAKKTATPTKKSVVPQPVTTRATAASAPTNAAMPPVQSSPTPPAGFEPIDKAASAALSKPNPVQVASGGAVATELAASKTYAKDFSASAPAVSAVTGALDAAEAWTNEEANAQAWARYASTQKQLAWSTALTTMASLQKEYAYAAAHDATVPTRYPELTRFLKAKHAQSEHAAATRRANVKKAKKATPAT